MEGRASGEFPSADSSSSPIENWNPLVRETGFHSEAAGAFLSFRPHMGYHGFLNL